MKSPYLTKAARVFCPVLIGLIVGCGGSSSGDFDEPALISGRATFPQDGIDSSPSVPVIGAQVLAISFGETTTAKTTNPAEGTTDENGDFEVTMGPGGGAIFLAGIIIEADTSEEVPITLGGLVRQEATVEIKDITDITDIAYRAYDAAEKDGVVFPGDLNKDLIDELEKAADQYLEENEVDFFDPASIAQAVNAVRETTGHSVLPTPEEMPVTPTPQPDDNGLGCSEGGATCADGFPICAEQLCDGKQDCLDGSDEQCTQ